MFKNRIIFPILLASVLFLPWKPAHAFQPGVPGFAEIQSPVPGQAISGLITIRGTADHPSFESYEVFFAHDPNPTGTWFPLTERIETPVQGDGLALWETGDVTAGTYQLRLVVYTEQGQDVEANISGLRLGAVNNQAEVSALGSPAEPQPQESNDPDPEIQAMPETEPVESPSQQPPTPTDILWRVLTFGATAASVVMVSFGMYTLLRPRVREYAGLLKMRRLHQQKRRAERQERHGQ